MFTKEQQTSYTNTTDNTTIPSADNYYQPVEEFIANIKAYKKWFYTSVPVWYIRLRLVSINTGINTHTKDPTWRLVWP